MKALLSILFLFLATTVNAEVCQGDNCPCIEDYPGAGNCATQEGSNIYDLLCAPKIFSHFGAPGEQSIQCGLFDSHEEAERNWYHCAEGVAIMGAAICQLDNKFVPVLSTEDFAKLSGNHCDKEIYPDSGICYSFPSHKIAEDNYKSCRTTNYQYWDYLQKLRQSAIPACQDGGDFFDGAYQGALWKPQADPKALCKNGTTILLPSEYVGKVDPVADILDVNYNKVETAKQLPYSGRVRFCMYKPGSVFGNQSLVVRYKVNGVNECRTVKNASQRED